MNPIPRRRFIRNAALAAAALKAWPVIAQSSTRSRVIGANDDIRVAVIGFNGRGNDLMNSVMRSKGVRLVALCDVDSAVLEKETKRLKDANVPVQGFSDMRRLFEDPNIDAVVFATPNHWHALGSIWAVQAGKDVYVEKPVSHNVWEGRKIVEAARRHGRIVQTGTQCRSSVGLREAMAWLHEGNLGKVTRARGLCYKRRNSLGKVEGPQPVPSTVNYDLWCGPAPMTPLNRKRLHYDWHWVWETGNGDLGNQGIHQMDIARWALREPALSPQVISIGGRLGYEDDGTTANTQIVFHDYKTAPLIFEVRGLPSATNAGGMDKYRGADIGVVIDCEGGSMVIPSYTKAIVHDGDGVPVKVFEGGGDHFGNFFNAMRSRKHSDLHADILEGHISSALCHTGNISHQLGAPLPPAAILDSIRGNSDLAESLGRLTDHLEDNGVDLFKTPLTLGALLKMNPRTERFTNNPKANTLLTREYREPFVVRERV